jgi:hypothetical protein
MRKPIDPWDEWLERYVEPTPEELAKAMETIASVAAEAVELQATPSSFVANETLEERQDRHAKNRAATARPPLGEISERLLKDVSSRGDPKLVNRKARYKQTEHAKRFWILYKKGGME